MVKGRISVIIPACNEGFLQSTIDSLLDGAAGDVQIIAVIDGGPWPDPPLRNDPRLLVVRNNAQQGMRQSFNAAAQIATGEFLMKCDGHCIFAPSWDAALTADCDDDWLVVPTRHSIDGDVWKQHPRDGQKAVKHRHYNYHFLTWPFDLGLYGYGLHAKTFDWNTNRVVNDRWKSKPIDDLMSFQGSCWFTHATLFHRLWPNGLDYANYYFYQEAQEIGLTVWMSGGRCVINKNTWYGHYHKGQNNLHTIDGREGRGFFLNVHKKRSSEKYATDYWLNDQMPNAQRTFVQFIERFSDLLELLTPPDRWPDDWRDFETHKAAFKARPVEQTPAHT
jgi:glycosyltransferase involved in cell wall biosynthesis